MSIRYDAKGLGSAYTGEALGIDPKTRAQYAGQLDDAVRAIMASHVRNELGFLTCIDDDTTAITDFAKAVFARNFFTDQLVIGIGGSSLGGRAVLASASQAQMGGLRTHFSENIDPVGWNRLLETLDLEHTLITVITKSGSTIETMSKFWIVYAKLIELVGQARAATQIVAITDPVVGGLRALASAHGFTTFDVPSNVGGRFSVLTAVGLVPLALAGYPIDALLAGAQAARDHGTTASAGENTCAQVALDQVLLARAGVTTCVMMSYSDLLAPMVDWFVQLWAESLGKVRPEHGDCVGIMPVKALGAIDQHSQVQLYMEGPLDKHVTFLRLESHWSDATVPVMEGLPEGLAHLPGKSLSELLEAELQGTYHALMASGRPVSMWHFDALTPENVGAFILSWELSTAIAGQLFEINPFDQPGVELGKKIAHGLLGREDCFEVSSRYISETETASDEHVFSLF